MKMKKLGSAKRVRVEMPLGARRGAWDCRAFGFGRIVTPIMSTDIELGPGVHLNLQNGELRSALSSIAA